MPNTRKESAATHHFVNKALDGLLFPASKSQIAKVAGDTVVPTGNGNSATVSELLKKIEVEDFSCAAAFFCALTASMQKNA